MLQTTRQFPIHGIIYTWTPTELYIHVLTSMVTDVVDILQAVTTFVEQATFDTVNDACSLIIGETCTSP